MGDGFDSDKGNNAGRYVGIAKKERYSVIRAHITKKTSTTQKAVIVKRARTFPLCQNGTRVPPKWHKIR